MFFMCPLASSGSATSVVESERAIPVCREVDVVVVGGTCGAVAAAQAAAQAGATVFLAAPRPYLGDDVAGAMRLWLNEGETPVSPLAKSLFVLTNSALPFTYTADVQSTDRHEDTGELLCDGRYKEASSQSVEFKGDVTFTLTLDAEKEITGIDLMAFRRAGDFMVGGATVSASQDGKQWGAPVPLAIGDGADPEHERYSASLTGKVKFLKVAVQKKSGAKRVLLGELVVHKRMPAGGEVVVPTLLHVKQALDRALLEANVSFLTGSYATDVLRDAEGKPSGIVMANRSGRQAVVAKVVIDASERGAVARLAGARFQPYPAGPQLFTRVILAGEAPSSKGVTAKRLPGDYEAPITAGPRKSAGRSVAGKAFECSLRIDMKDGSFRSFAEAEQVALDRTFVKSLLDGADSLFQVPPDPMAGEVSLAGEWPGAAEVGLACFKPAGVARFYVLGGCADLPRAAAERLLRPLALMAVGARIGAAAAAEAKGLPAPKGVSRTVRNEAADRRGEVKEFLAGVRPFQTATVTVPSAKGALPVLGEYDVVVVGGGTCGAPAGIASGRQGARTLVVEQLHGMGGIGTLGMIGLYCFGNVCGFTSEYDQGVKELGADVNVNGKREWWRRANRKAGTELWFGAIGCGTLVDGNRVTGVIVATPDGRGVVLAKNVVDATGNSDVAAAAGAACMFLGSEEIAVQGVGLSPRQLGASYINSDFGYANDCDAGDLWLFGVRGRARADNVWDVSQLVQSRERQRIVGDAFLTPLDIVNTRTFPDTVVQARSNFDSHGYTIADICYVCGPNTPRVYMANIPYRAMLPKGFENIIVSGLGISAHRDAMPIIRMQPDVQNMGYVAGVAAATASREGTSVRAIKVKELQAHLVEKGVLPKDVLEWQDSWPINPERLTLAVKNVGNASTDVSLVLDHADEALPLLRQAYAAAQTPEARLCYANVLGILGDATGVSTLVDAVEKTPEEPQLSLHWSERLGRRMSDLDTYMVALGRTRDKRALEPLLAKVKAMDASSPFYSFRAVTLALEALGDPAAAKPLADLLQKPGLGGYAMNSVSAISDYGYGNGNERNLALRELALARALYRCGDCEGVAEKVLKSYALDLRGVYALHATAVLKGGKK